MPATTVLLLTAGPGRHDDLVAALAGKPITTKH